MQRQLAVLKKLKYNPNEDILTILYDENVKSNSFDSQFKLLMKKV